MSKSIEEWKFNGSYLLPMRWKHVPTLHLEADPYGQVNFDEYENREGKKKWIAWGRFDDGNRTIFKFVKYSSFITTQEIIDRSPNV